MSPVKKSEKHSAGVDTSQPGALLFLFFHALIAVFRTPYILRDMRRKVKFVNQYFYHIYNRGVEKRIIFFDEEDYTRFIYYLYELNNKNLVADTAFFNRKIEIDSGVRNTENMDQLVEILCFCLMPNHFHLLLRQVQDGGISLFLQKLCLAYAGYFNQKYNRVGGLFQGAFKAKLIDKTEYINHLFYYILANPIEIIEPRCKERGIKNLHKAKLFLSSYRWSSYKDLIGNELNFPFLVDRKSITEIFGHIKEFKQFIKEVLQDDKLSDIKELILE